MPCFLCFAQSTMGSNEDMLMSTNNTMTKTNSRGCNSSLAGGVVSTLHSNKSANKCIKMSMETLIVLPNNSRAIEEEMAVIRIISMKRLRWWEYPKVNLTWVRSKFTAIAIRYQGFTIMQYMPIRLTLLINLMVGQTRKLDILLEIIKIKLKISIISNILAKITGTNSYNIRQVKIQIKLISIKIY